MKDTKTNKSIPMDKSMIDDIHELILMHMKAVGKPLSFGQASRIILETGMAEIKKRAKMQKEHNRDLRHLTGYGWDE